MQKLLVGRDVDRAGRFDNTGDVCRGHFLVLDRDHAARIETADMAAGDTGINVPYLAVRHQFRLFKSGLNGFHSRLDIDDDTLFESFRLMLSQTDHFVSSVRQDFSNDSHDFGCADIQADNQIFKVFSHNATLSCLLFEAESVPFTFKATPFG